jgi:hypothetical protein
MLWGLIFGDCLSSWGLLVDGGFRVDGLGFVFGSLVFGGFRVDGLGFVFGFWFIVK